MRTKTNKTVWSTIKFPKKFVTGVSAYSKKKGWKSSCEYIMAAMDFIYKHDLDLHGELPPECQTTVTLLDNAMKMVADMLGEFPEKAELIQQVNKLTADLASMQTDRDKAVKAIHSWRKAYDSLKAEKQEALDEMERQKQEVSRLTGLTIYQDGRLQSVTDKVNETLRQIEGENSFLGRFGMDGKRYAIALETLRWVASETAKSP